jgi:hypothetical protein
MKIDEYILEDEGEEAVLPFAPVADAGNAGLVTGVQDYDGAELAQEGMLPLPVYAKCVQDVDGNIVQLRDLCEDGNLGGWQAATVAKCTLPDGTLLRLKLHTRRNGDTLVFELTTSEYYS